MRSSIVGERIKQRRIALNMTQTELGEMIGVAGATITRYETGNIKNLKYEIIVKLSESLKCSPAYLVGWQESSFDKVQTIPVDTFYKIPVIGSVRCGFGGAAVEENTGNYDVASVKNPNEYRYFVAKGDSMLPKIEEGDLALVHIQPDIESGELAVVIINGDEGTLKRIIKQDKSIILQSFNSNYPPKIFSGKEISKICIYGKVIETKKKW